ncbi:MAG: hypothetical protein HY272_13430 [Gammaproteobacteria bacterium]|nr:hypothetical protein [Gammaproteobacteria bacterium]
MLWQMRLFPRWVLRKGAVALFQFSRQVSFVSFLRGHLMCVVKKRIVYSRHVPVRLLQLLVLSVCGVAAAWGAEERTFSVGMYLGVHRPALEELNQYEFQSPVAGTATLTNAATGGNDSVSLYFPNPLPELGLGTNAGLEFQWQLDRKNSVIFGGSTWEASSRATIDGLFSLQGELAEVHMKRAAKMSYNEFYAGVRRYVIDEPKRYKVYYRLTLNEIYDIDYREDLSFTYLTGLAKGVTKNIVLMSQATGLLALQPGIGGDYFFRDWMSVGIEASYLIGLRAVQLREGALKQDFLITDNLDLFLPYKINTNYGYAEYLRNPPKSRDDYDRLDLSFDGWKILARLNLYF